MENDLFKLVSTYEILLYLEQTDRPVRIEVFRSLSDCQMYRARVWVQNTYNLYPTLLNTGNRGEDTHTMHSCDLVNMEITLAIAEDPDFITGKHYKDEEDFVDYIKSRIVYYHDSLKA